MPFPGSVSNKAKQAKRRNVIFQCRFSGLSRHEFLFSVQRQSSRSFFGCDKRIWIEKSSLYSTKALLISAYRFSFTFDEITAFISNSDVFSLRTQTYFRLSLVSAENKLFSAETSDSRKYVCVRRLGCIAFLNFFQTRFKRETNSVQTTRA